MDDFISYQTYSKFPLLYENSVSEAAETRISILRFSIVNVNDCYNYAPHRHTGPELMFSVRRSYDCTLNDREFSVPTGHGIFIQPGDIHCDHCGAESRFVALVFRVLDPIGNPCSDFFRPGSSMEKRLFCFDRSPEIREVFDLAVRRRSGGDAFLRQTAASLATALIWNIFSLLKDQLSDAMVGALNDNYFRSRILDLFFAHIDRPLSVQEAAEALGMSRRSLEYKFKALFGKPPSKVFTAWKIRQAIRLLQAGMSSKSVAQELGFANQFHFSRVFREQTGTNASAFCAKR